MQQAFVIKKSYIGALYCLCVCLPCPKKNVEVSDWNEYKFSNQRSLESNEKSLVCQFTGSRIKKYVIFFIQKPFELKPLFTAFQHNIRKKHRYRSFSLVASKAAPMCCSIAEVAISWRNVTPSSGIFSSYECLFSVPFKMPKVNVKVYITYCNSPRHVAYLNYFALD